MTRKPELEAPTADTPLNQREAAKLATQQAVLAAARDSFEELGFERANLREIAARADVSAGTVLHYYGDKRGLLHAALFEELDAALDHAIAAAQAAPTLLRQLNALTRAVFAYYKARPSLSRVALRESLFADPPWAERFAAQTTRVSQAIALLAGAARARGELPASTDPTLLSVTYLSIFYFALIAWVQQTIADPEALVAVQLRHLFHPAENTPDEPQPVPRRRRA
ncbi:MAG: TetR/AcrR family transcriptional regulator [Sandaracinaceae bacterium]|nr:TetR/AcrR family transcriptional regulator [Sandaracinaceae bacterium]